MKQTFSVVIADDEPLAREVIRNRVRDSSDFEVVAECATVETLLNVCARTTFDLLFLDIRMPDGSGIDALGALPPDRPFEVVMVTAHDEYALEAFDGAALDYVMKPFSDARLDASLTRAQARLRAKRAMHGPAAAAPLERLIVTTGSRRIVVPVSSIDMITAEDYCARVRCGGTSYLVRYSLAQLERLLDPRRFVRVHRSTIVPLDRVRECRRDARGAHWLLLESGIRVDVSERRHAAVMRALAAGRRPG